MAVKLVKDSGTVVGIFNKMRTSEPFAIKMVPSKCVSLLFLTGLFIDQCPFLCVQMIKNPYQAFYSLHWVPVDWKLLMFKIVASCSVTNPLLVIGLYSYELESL